MQKRNQILQYKKHNLSNNINHIFLCLSRERYTKRWKKYRYMMSTLASFLIRIYHLLIPTSHTPQDTHTHTEQQRRRRTITNFAWFVYEYNKNMIYGEYTTIICRICIKIYSSVWNPELSTDKTGYLANFRRRSLVLVCVFVCVYIFWSLR